jgi:HAD superfamily hydrolase (TIGR01549 family)
MFLTLKITNQEFVHLIAQKTSVPSEKIWPEIFQEIIINDTLLALIKSLKKRYKIGLLSNFSHVWLKEIFEKHGLHEFFDELFISSQHGIIKPQEQAFLTILNLLKVEKNEALFIDDRQINIQAAEKLGIKALLYTTTGKLKKDLSKINITVD